MRLARQLVLCALTPAAAAAQLLGGVGPVGQLSSSESAWRTTARLWGAGRFENSWTSFDLAGSLSRTDDSFRIGDISASQRLFSPAMHGVRSITTVNFEEGSELEPSAGSRLTATTSLSYRRGASGGWLGLGAGSSPVCHPERSEGSARASGECRSLVTLGMTEARLGAWRQLANWLTVSVGSSARRRTSSAMSVQYHTVTYFDTLMSDSGAVVRQRDETRADTSLLQRTLGWLETEGHVGMSRGRVAFDAAVGYRPAADSTQPATWYRGTATIALTRAISVTAGAGTLARQVIGARPTGHYATFGVRLAPAELVRPNEMPEITPVASSFRVERSGDQYAVRVRLPRARIVELSGDFNSWQPIRLTRELDGSWVALLDLQPGAYRMNIRIDGEQWVPPPGTTAVDDEFNGKVGLVVVR